ncbi:SDR family NAD(P)-dependent oxidoreductase [Paenibacillus sp. SC116]|uniref:type I polyketide synthase n=1 Tax=Paenibacillus sp. SC116 TaxID=2968986 RepID=UPI00215AD832|nr:type I polyketide synthase [Paenibacillus sp. SC116]MCR8844348.1 SDR family NAD(P)-dependent oxidoreductase [Paenibacillus sp. SC116]
MDFQSIKLNRKSVAVPEDDVAFDQTSNANQDIAIIGIALKLPLADTVDQFASNLEMGRDCVRPIPQSRKQDTDLYFKRMGMNPEEVAYGEAAYLTDIDKFDYPFFKLSPKEASLLDPNQRLFLQTAWKAIEDAGYSNGKLAGSRTGVYVGYGSDADYLKLIRQVEPEAVSMSMTGNVRPIIASRLSYLMDLRGPSLLVDTTCSSSLVAVHLACQAIRNGECEAAIVGGIQLHLIPVREYEVGIESSTSRARTFDDDADGTGTGEGVVAMMIKPLDQAREARDHIYAVIKSSAMSQDGGGSAGITAPNAEAQEAVIVDAWKRAGIDPETIGYIETHGTGTKLGDPIEHKGLERAFRRFTDKRQFCAIGALKSNIGHLDNTAGIAGLLKAVMSLKHKRIYPTLHFDRPNRVIDFANSPVYVNDKLREWESSPSPRRCGVSSFGISGTNCHVILEEAPEGKHVVKQDKPHYHLFLLSAQSESALQAYVESSIQFLQQNPSVNVGDLCFSLSTGRGHYRYRLAIAANGAAEVLEELIRFNKIGFASFMDEREAEPSGYLYGDYIERADRNSSQWTAIHSNIASMAASFAKSDKYDRELCGELGKLYVQGANYNWEQLYRQERRKRISFPTYPFDPYRCWVKLDASSLDETSPLRKVHGDRSNAVNEQLSHRNGHGYENTHEKHSSSFYHHRIWCPEPLTNSGQTIGKRTTIMLFHNDDQIAAASLVRRWEDEDASVIQVVMGEQYERRDARSYVIRDEAQDYEQLLLDMADVSLTHIVDLRYISKHAQVDDAEAHERVLDQTMYRFYRLAHALTRRSSNEPLDMMVVSQYADEVVADQARVQPEQSAMIGLSKAIGWENPHIRLRWIDLDEGTDAVDVIGSELGAESSEFWTSYRNGQRYVERVDVLHVDERHAISQPVHVDADGVYVITGGLGSIGLLIAAYLATEAKGIIHLALLGRTLLPPREQWSAIEHEGKDRWSIRAMRVIREMEARGAQVELIRADTADEVQVRMAIAELRQRFGRIAGVVHAAGIAEGNVISQLNSTELRAIVAAKTTGTWLLDHLTRADKPDFFVLFSSAITLVGGIGSGPYTAGNAYLDGYSAFRNRLGLRTLTINWPAWKQIGVTEDNDADESKEMFCLMSAEQGVRAFQALLQSSVVNGESETENVPDSMSAQVSIRQAIVGYWNHQSGLFALGDRLPFRQSEQVQHERLLSSSSHGGKESSRLATDNRNTAAGTEKWNEVPSTYSEIEGFVIRAWKRVLGYEELDVHANFFEIGGDSILITRVHKSIDEVFPSLTTISDLFSYPTVARITSHLHAVITSRAATSDLRLNTLDSKAESPEIAMRGLESSQQDPFNEVILDMFGRMKRGELSIKDAVGRFRELEVANE